MALRNLTFDITGWRGFIAPVRVDGWVMFRGEKVGATMCILFSGDTHYANQHCY